MRFRLAMVLVVAGVLGLSLGSSGRTAHATPTSPVDEPKVADEKVPTFKNDVMPLLKNACGNCHITRKKGGVDLSSYTATMKTVKAGEPDKSRLVKSVLGQGAKLMPPKAGLPDAQVQILKAWIAAGAKDD